MKNLSILFAFIFFSTAYAEDWSFNLNVNQGLSYDDNVTMSQDAQGSFAYELIPNLTVLYKTEIVELQADASYGIQHYTNIDGFDFSLQQYSVKGIYSTESTQFGLSARYSILPSIRTAEEDSGEFNLTSNKETKTISPFISYDLTETDVISITGIYTENTFSEGAFGDNNLQNIALSWQRDWTQQYKTDVSVFFSRYEFMDSSFNTTTNTILGNKTNSDNYGINFSSTFLLSDSWSITGVIGARTTETTENQSTRNSSGFLTNTSIDYVGEQFLAKLAVARALIPTNQGQLEEQTKLSINLGYRITEQVSASFLAHYQISKRESNNRGNDETERENITFSPSINWEMSQNLMFSASYRYRLQDESDKNHSVDSNLFMLSISYDWPGQIEK